MKSFFHFETVSGAQRGSSICGCRRGFSLIEVVLALAVFSFSIFTLMGLLATGLNSAAGSSGNLAMANIERVVRANIYATTYANITSTTSATTAYYTAAGYPTVLSPVSAVDSPYYAVSYSVVAPVSSLVSSGKIVQVTISYPYPANAHTSSFSLFVAQ